VSPRECQAATGDGRDRGHADEKIAAGSMAAASAMIAWVTLDNLFYRGYIAAITMRQI
jgi:hypothetical protein